MKVVDLNDDVLRLIFETAHAAKPWAWDDLASLALLHRNITPVAQRLLFCDIGIGILYSDYCHATRSKRKLSNHLATLDSEERSAKLVAALETSAQLRNMVRRLTIDSALTWTNAISLEKILPLLSLDLLTVRGQPRSLDFPGSQQQPRLTPFEVLNKVVQHCNISRLDLEWVPGKILQQYRISKPHLEVEQDDANHEYLDQIIRQLPPTVKTLSVQYPNRIQEIKAPFPALPATVTSLTIRFPFPRVERLIDPGKFLKNLATASQLTYLGIGWSLHFHRPRLDIEGCVVPGFRTLLDTCGKNLVGLRMTADMWAELGDLTGICPLLRSLEIIGSDEMIQDYISYLFELYANSAFTHLTLEIAGVGGIYPYFLHLCETTTLPHLKSMDIEGGSSVQYDTAGMVNRLKKTRNADLHFKHPFERL